MGGDYTRVTFDPTKAYSGVRTQQGRVSLDADFNEFEAILDRRRRVETIDTIGRSVVPLTTPDGFEIALAAGQLTIGPGRAYVDGILVECLGQAPPAPPVPPPPPALPPGQVHDAGIGEDRGTIPLPYLQQPFVYSAPNAGQPFPVPSTAAGATDLVYLDVWTREVTALEDTELLEPALGGPGGPDTTTRLQSAWQVKVLAGVTATSCEENPPEWLALIAPSTARLTAAAAPGPPTAQPCVIDPAGGYTGLENRLYRIEVHQAGVLDPTAPGAPPGALQARFKWSRDNASLAARVLSITATPTPGQSVIAVVRTGRDRFLRLEPNDHIELLDDDVEYALRERGVGGSLARILSVDYANDTLLVDQDLTAFAVVEARHPRVRRWDVDPLAQPPQAPVRDATPGVAIALEQGISITFSSDPLATVHAGDYWVVAARTATGALLDPPVNAPPHGVLHHFGKLALVTVGHPEPEDCREFWPAPGCCSEVVFPGQSIQAAIDRLPATGGCVCLKTGVHAIDAPIRIERSNVCLQGETLGAIVRRSSGEALLDVGDPAGARIGNICVERIRFEGTEDPQGRGAMIVVTDSNDVAVRGCEFAAVGGGLLAAVAISTTGSGPLTIERNEIRFLLGGVLVANGAVLTIDDNVLLGPTEVIQLAAQTIIISMGVFGIRLADDCGPQNSIRRNIVHDFRFGIHVGRGAEPTVVEDNVVRRQGPFSPARLEPSEMLGGSATTDPLMARAWAIASRAPRAVIRHNRVTLTDPSHGGIIALGSDTVVDHNRIEGTVSLQSVRTAGAPPLGIVVTPDPSSEVVRLEHCTVRQNTLRGLMGAITLGSERAETDACEVIANSIEGLDGVVEQLSSEITDDSGVDSAAQLQLAVTTLLAALTIGYGIGVLTARRCTIARNVLDRVLLGIALGGVTDTRVAENHLTLSFAGVTVVSGTTVAIEANTVVRPHVWGVLGAFVTGGVIVGNTVRQTFGPSVVLAAGADARVRGNDARAGGYGIVLLSERRAEVCDNVVDDMRRTGIASVFALEAYRCVGNRVSRSGREGAPVTILFRFGPGPLIPIPVPLAVAISALYSSGRVEIESCDVSGTGEVGDTGGTPFAGQRVPVLVYFVPRVRVHGCTLRGATGPAVNQASFVMYVEAQDLAATGDTAQDTICDVLDTLAEGLGETLVRCAAENGEIIFAANRCRNHRSAPDTAGATVVLRGRIHSLTGNRVRIPPGAGARALSISGSRLTATSNITNGAPLLVLGAPEVPTYATANLIL